MWVGERGLASPHPILGAISGAPGFCHSCVVSLCCLRRIPGFAWILNMRQAHVMRQSIVVFFFLSMAWWIHVYASVCGCFMVTPLESGSHWFACLASGSTVDTCLRQLPEAWGVLLAGRT